MSTYKNTIWTNIFWITYLNLYIILDSILHLFYFSTIRSFDYIHSTLQTYKLYNTCIIRLYVILYCILVHRLFRIFTSTRIILAGTRPRNRSHQRTPDVLRCRRSTRNGLWRDSSSAATRRGCGTVRIRDGRWHQKRSEENIIWWSAANEYITEYRLCIMITTNTVSFFFLYSFFHCDYSLIYFYILLFVEPHDCTNTNKLLIICTKCSYSFNSVSTMQKSFVQ